MAMSAEPATPLPGFADPVFDAQRLFRVVLDAMSHPGRIVEIGGLPDAPAPLTPTAAAVCLTLADFDTPLWIDDRSAGAEAARRHLRFHCGCPLPETHEAAAFAVVTAPEKLPPLASFAQGSDEYPDRSATIVLQVDRLTGEAGVVLKGPGIEDKTAFDAGPLPADFWAQVQANRTLFPRGVDLIFAAADRVAALPRSVRVEV
ncbi:MAG: phosphonate C-P lyase system protein PhnH [Minwuiales bacterium]|nr:phosphonate C-P lyase system protein PhnH [Minwuiales bacterium]